MNTQADPLEALRLFSIACNRGFPLQCPTFVWPGEHRMLCTAERTPVGSLSPAYLESAQIDSRWYETLDFLFKLSIGQLGCGQAAAAA